MNPDKIKSIFNDDFLKELFPPTRADEFFDALYGGAEEGAFDITLGFNGIDPGSSVINLEFRLTERPGKCMACSLTYGLPPVFERHPIIGIKGMIEKIEKALPDGFSVKDWKLGATTPVAPKLNVIPFLITIEKK